MILENSYGLQILHTYPEGKYIYLAEYSSSVTVCHNSHLFLRPIFCNVTIGVIVWHCTYLQEKNEKRNYV